MKHRIYYFIIALITLFLENSAGAFLGNLDSSSVSSIANMLLSSPLSNKLFKEKSLYKDCPICNQSHASYENWHRCNECQWKREVKLREHQQWVKWSQSQMQATHQRKLQQEWEQNVRRYEQQRMQSMMMQPMQPQQQYYYPQQQPQAYYYPQQPQMYYSPQPMPQAYPQQQYYYPQQQSQAYYYPQQQPQTYYSPPPPAPQTYYSPVVMSSPKKVNKKKVTQKKKCSCKKRRRKNCCQ